MLILQIRVQNGLFMKRFRLFFLAVLALCTACTKPAQQPSEEEQTYLYVNTFARDYMRSWYLWNKEIAKDLDAWKDSEEPIAKVAAIRYKDASGKDIDRWTMVTDDYSSFYGSVSGNRKTYGFDFILYYTDENKTSLCAVVTYTYSGSPAEQAGLKRGDVIVKVNGKTIPAKDYSSIVYDELMGGDSLTAALSNGTTVTLEAREMYENPVLMDKVFDCGGKKVGYLVYTSFTLDSYQDLIDACTRFKEAGVKELILDLRYNGGGFATAEEFLASMLAPEAVVKAGAVLSTEVYNEELTKYYASLEDYDANTYFKTDFTIKSGGKTHSFSTAGANPDLDKLYCIISSGSASASEALICDLYPYMPVTLVGEKSHGKYCAGLMLKTEDYYKTYADELGEEFAAEGKKRTANWGMYLMYSRFADKDGVTRCMPDGLTPDVAVQDRPDEGIQLGDPDEKMLARTLSLCGYNTAVPHATSRSVPASVQEKVDAEPFRPGFGMMIK